MIGETISHYKILEKIGEGGMGMVYKAEDTSLHRIIALKFLSRQALGTGDERARFVHEAQAAASLNHANICTVHEIGESEDHSFIAMEYVEGESLKERIASGPLKLEAVIDTAIQVAQGLQEAHEKGVVHRDIKPANIMLTPKEQAKIMDFGLAKVSDRTKLTKEGTTLGTVAYMSPEHISVEGVDHRSDIWSLGVMLYEMVVGRGPFEGDYDQAVFYAILNEEPEPVTALRTGVPMELERIITKALAKDPDERYQHVGEMLVDLKTLEKRIEAGSSKQPVTGRGKRKARRVAILTGILAIVIIAVILGRQFIFPSATEEIDSIAVLPLENLTGDKEKDYVVDGITEALITELAKIEALRVISRQSVMRYKESDKPLPQIARELNVTAVVEGSVFLSGDRVRITAQLIGAVPERHLWTDNYDRDLGDLLILSSEVAQAIAREIQVTLTPQDQARLSSVRSVNSEAHDLYLKGKNHYYKLTREGCEKANEYFHQAIEADSNYARAYAGLAASYEHLTSYFEYLPVQEAYTKCIDLIGRALEIDDTLAEAYVALAAVRFFLAWDWLGGVDAVERAIELNPGLAEAHLQYAYILNAMGRFEESIAEAKRALQLDPVSPLTNETLAYMYHYAREYDQAIAQWRYMAEMKPNDPRPYGGIAWEYTKMGRYEDAVEAHKKAMTLSGTGPEEIAALESAYSESGSRGYWMWRLERAKLSGGYDRYPVSTAAIYAHLGDKDQAMAWLEKAYEKHDGWMYLLKVTQSFDSLRDDPRFQDLMRRMKFTENEAH